MNDVFFTWRVTGQHRWCLEIVITIITIFFPMMLMMVCYIDDDDVVVVTFWILTIFFYVYLFTYQIKEGWSLGLHIFQMKLRQFELFLLFLAFFFSVFKLVYIMLVKLYPVTTSTTSTNCPIHIFPPNLPCETRIALKLDLADLTVRELDWYSSQVFSISYCLLRTYFSFAMFQWNDLN